MQKEMNMPITEETSPATPPIPDYVPGMTADEDEINLLDLFLVLHPNMIYYLIG
jgi:hypothetical protein